MKFKTHYLDLSVNERESLALQAGTTRGTLNQVVYGGKEIELGLADCLVALCPGIGLSDLPLTARAKQQHAVRNGAEKSASQAVAEA
jgi:hypothetical protein